MNFSQYKRLRKIVDKGATFGEFLAEVARWPKHYAVTEPTIWTKANYLWFYNRIKGGANHAKLFDPA